jgi:hypothetical protein
MKINHLKQILILCMSVLLLNCKKEVIDEEPVVYDFTKNFDGKDKIPEVKVTPIEVVKVNSAQVKQSATAEAIIKSLVDSSKVQTGLDKAADAIKAELGDSLIKKIDVSFTPEVLQFLTEGGTLASTDSLTSALVTEIVASGAMDELLAEFVFPSINILNNGGRKKSEEILFGFNAKLNLNFSNADTQDECSDAAKAAYNNSIKSLDSLNAIYIANIELTYQSRIGSFNTTFTQTTVIARYDSLRQVARNVINNAVIAINKLSITETRKEAYRVVFYTLFNDFVKKYNDGQFEDIKANNNAKNINIANAEKAKTADLEVLKTNYDTAKTNINNEINAIPCHNQGG